MSPLRELDRPTKVIGFALVLLILQPVPLQAQQNREVPSSGDPNLAFTAARQLGNVPDDIGYQLRESQERIDAIFRFGPLTPLHKFWDRSTVHLEQSLDLDVGLNYTAIYQRADATVRGPREAGDGDLDFFGRWNLLTCERHSLLGLVFSSETRHKYSAIAPNRLDTGTAGGTIVGFDEQDFSLVQLFLEAGSYEDRYIARAGKMDPALIYDGGRYVSSNYAFFSPAFSDTLPMPLPGAGLGLVGAVYPTRTTYLVAGLHDANGKRTTAGFNTFFGEGEFFTAIEFGWFPKVDQPNEGLYHLTLWNIDSRKALSRPGDRGLAFTLEQPLGRDGKYVPFLRYSYANRGLNDIRQNLSVGLGIENVFNQNDDLIGVAASWQQLSSGGSRDQSVIETFYRLYVTPRTHVSPDIQVVIDPANAPSKSHVALFGLRLRTLF